jgi:hypothetical protein
VEHGAALKRRHDQQVGKQRPTHSSRRLVRLKTTLGMVVKLLSRRSLSKLTDRIYQTAFKQRPCIGVATHRVVRSGKRPLKRVSSFVLSLLSMWVNWIRHVVSGSHWGHHKTQDSTHRLVNCSISSVSVISLM